MFLTSKAKSQNATYEIQQNPKHMQATSDLNRQAKSKSQNPLIKQRKNRISETTRGGMASDMQLGFGEGFDKGEIGEGFSLASMADVQKIRNAQGACGPATILAIGTANPPNCAYQDDFPDYYFSITKGQHKTELKEKFKRI
ncbi:hypothetical protein CMV_030233, partial [Castanea mollissima]